MKTRRSVNSQLVETRPSDARRRTIGAALNCPIGADLRIVARQIRELRANPKNARDHGQRQIEKLAANLRRFGFMVPILVDRKGEIIAGHARVEAARAIGLREIPTILIEHLSEAERRAFAIADNRLAQLADWKPEILAAEFKFLNSLELDFDLEITGFNTAEIDVFLDPKPNSDGDDAADHLPPVEEENAPTTMLGDIWDLGRHRLVCGDTLRRETFQRLMDGETARLVFTDVPYNVPIAGNVTRSKRTRHGEFAMASGEMTEDQFVEFLRVVQGNHAAASSDGSIHFWCIDWRHLYEMLVAGRSIYTELKNVAVWNKHQAGLGSFYRSKHELICIFKKGRGRHQNNFELGQHGRYRTNIWDYAGPTTTRNGGNADRTDHPTVKPVALVADAIKDCSKRGHLVLDGFSGSGTTLIAAEKTGRVARAIEIDPKFVDVTVRRWEEYSGETATLAETGETFAEVATRRAGASDTPTKTLPVRRRTRHG